MIFDFIRQCFEKNDQELDQSPDDPDLQRALLALRDIYSNMMQD